jgi:Tol biopolymer transport system component
MILAVRRIVLMFRSVPRRSSLTRPFVVSAVAGIVVAGTAGSSGAAAASPASRIVFAANRISVWFGEIYEIEPDGTRIDLSNSPAADVDPAVSPDGKWVAFASDRGGSVAIYVVGTDGTGLKRVSPRLFAPQSGEGIEAQIAWSADSSEIAAIVPNLDARAAPLYDTPLSGGWHQIAANASPSSLPAWSPDRKLISYGTNFGTIQVVSSAGKRQWWEPGTDSSAWSKSDRLAVVTNSASISLYSDTGRRLSSFEGNAFAWSLTGDSLASIFANQLELRHNGAGSPYRVITVASASDNNDSVSWLDDTHVGVDTNGGWVEYDLARDSVLKPPPAAANYADVLGAGGAFASPRPQGTPATSQQLLVGNIDTPAAAKVLATAPSCTDTASFISLQFVPVTGALIYESGCPNPSSDLYSISPDGSSPAQLTNTFTDETDPSLSPDGGSIAYVEQAFAEDCQGCTQTIWRIPSGGGTPAQLSHHSQNDGLLFDTSPSWSPDGSSLVYSSAGLNAPERLLELPAQGGSPHRLGTMTGVGDPVWGPKLIAFIDDAVPRPEIETYDPTTGVLRTVLDDTTHAARDKQVGPLAWSPSGRLAYIENDAQGRPSLFIIGSGKPAIDLAAILPRASEVTGLAWSPDGTQFALAATDANRIGEIYTIGINGRNLKQLTNGVGAVGDLSWR